jgi:ABC transport system ATP-binding/permease protein
MTALLTCRDLSAAYGDRVLFEDLSLVVHQGDRLGVIGANGTGKTTLLRILSEDEEPSGGEVARRKALRLTRVEQAPSFRPGATLLELVLEGLAEQAHLDPLDPTQQEVQARKTLARLGFTEPQLPVDHLSGGWIKRLSLARALAGDPEVLLLDEPTNHLDLDAILALEATLTEEARTVVVVSHDRAFLEQVATRVTEIDRRHPGGCLTVTGRYSDLLERREAVLEARERQQAALSGRVREEIAWLRRGPKARTSKSQSRVRDAEQMITALKDLQARGLTSRSDLSFSTSGRKTKCLMELQGVSKAFGAKRLFERLDLLVHPGLRLGVVGPNGCGKTTLLRLMTDELRPDSGAIRRAPHLSVVHFAQMRAGLDPDASLRRALCPDGDQVVVQGRSWHVAAWARRFGFKPEQLDQAVGLLSGGERAKVLIAQLVAQPADVLLLDEPTNDLDIPTLEVLEQSLRDFPGAVVMVVHDRYLLDRVATLILGLHGDGEAELFADFQQWLGARRPREASRARPESGSEPRALKAKAPLKPLPYKEQLEFDGMEAAIMEAEGALEVAQSALADESVAHDADELLARQATHDEAEAEVDRLYARWTELDEKRQRGRTRE